MVPTGPAPVDGHEKITENILARPRWHRSNRRRSMVMKNHREHFGATKMVPTGPSPVDGHEKITENILARPRWHRPDRRRSMVMKKSQRTFWRDRDGTDRTVAGRWS